MIDDVGGYGGRWVISLSRATTSPASRCRHLEPDTAELMAELPARCCLFGSTTNRIRSTRGNILHAGARRGNPRRRCTVRRLRVRARARAPDQAALATPPGSPHLRAPYVRSPSSPQSTFAVLRTPEQPHSRAFGRYIS
jgi:hypothetical protein